MRRYILPIIMLLALLVVFAQREITAMPYEGYSPTINESLIAVGATNTPTMTITPTLTITPTMTITPTATMTSTLTSTPTPTMTATPTAILNFLPIIRKDPSPTPTPTFTPTNTPTNTPTVTPSMTAVPVSGTGIFRKFGDTIYHEDNEAYTGACGFISFFDGSPAFGGESGFKARFCLDDHGCATSAPVDWTGYFEISFEDLRLEGEGYFQVLQGENESPVSDKKEFDSDGEGSLVRMDFRECTEGSDRQDCQYNPDNLVFEQPESVEVVNQDGTIERVPSRFCPSE